MTTWHLWCVVCRRFVVPYVPPYGTKGRCPDCRRLFR